MFKKLILMGIIVTSLVGCKQEYIDETRYQYEITSINGNEINGDIIGKGNFDNAGIYLLQDELNFKLNVGDKIEVTFNNDILDDIKSIEKMD